MDEYGLEKIEYRDEMTDAEKEQIRQKILRNLDWMLECLENHEKKG